MRTGLDIFDSEVWRGPHAALVLGWDDDQLAAVIEVLAPLLPGGLTVEMLGASAACARSLVEGFVVTGQPVHYSRNRNHYGSATRYRRGDRYYSYHYVTKAMDALAQAGLAGQALGEWGGSGGGGRQSVAWPTAMLLDLLERVIDVAESRGKNHEPEVIVLRDRDDKRDIDYRDTAETTAMRAQMQTLNEELGQLNLFLHGRRSAIPLLRRVFNGDTDRGGRCYCHGPSWQNIPAEERANLQLLIDGVLHPVVEIDYANLHAVMAYTEAGLALPPGDQYAIDGFDRDLVKRAFNVLLNATARHKAVAALSEELHRKNHDLWRRSGLATRLRRDCRPFAERVVAAVGDKHHPIAAYFGSDCGARFMRRDSEMAVQVMLRVLEATGRCPLPMHDSFLVADLNHEVLVQVMQEVAAEEGLPLCLKDSGGLHRWGPTPTAPSLHVRNRP